jgi:hypothetical protein
MARTARRRYMYFEHVDKLLSDYEEIGRRINQPWRWNASFGVAVVLRRLAKLGLGPGERLENAAGRPPQDPA